MVNRQKIGDLVVFFWHLLSKMKNTFGDIEMEQEFGDEKIKAARKMVVKNTGQNILVILKM